MFIISLGLAFGLFSKLGITEVEYANYLPLRWQRKEKEFQLSEDFLISLQQQLTDKNINNLLKMCEYYSDIKIKTLGDEPSVNMLLDISRINRDNCINEFLSELFNMGYSGISDTKKMVK